MTTFSDLGLSSKACKATTQLGYTEPTPVQEQAIPLILEGRDVIAGAQTGTGKTAAFMLPCMDKLDFAGQGAGPTMLVVTPTRELATQIGEVAAAIAKQTKHKVMVVVGGVSYKPQIEGLARGCDVLIATPGRLEDLISQEAADLSLVSTLVLDEADRMLDMGFLPAVERIVDNTHPERQTLLFSATIGPEVQRVSKRFMANPARVEIARKGDTAEAVEQLMIRISHPAKPSLLKAVLEERGADRVIVFARTRHRADACCRRVRKAGFKVDVIHSDRSQSQRKRALAAFAEGKIGVLVATDVLARGIDVDQVSYVVNYDLPAKPEDYIHRIGRTGRAGHDGLAISFVSPENEEMLRDIEKLTHQQLKEIEVANFDKEAVERDAESRALDMALRREKDPEVAKAMKEMAAASKAARKKQDAAAKASTTAPKSKKSEKAERAKDAKAGRAKAGKTEGAQVAKGGKAERIKATKARKAERGSSKTSKVEAAEGSYSSNANNFEKPNGTKEGYSKKAKKSRSTGKHKDVSPVFIDELLALIETESEMPRKKKRAAQSNGKRKATRADKAKRAKKLTKAERLASRPPAKATGKAAKISAERFESKLAGVESLAGKSGKSDKFGSSRKSVKLSKFDKSAKSGKSSRSAASNKSGNLTQSSKQAKSTGYDKPNKLSKSARYDKPGKLSKSARYDKPNKLSKSARYDKPGKFAQSSKSSRPHAENSAKKDFAPGRAHRAEVRRRRTN